MLRETNLTGRTIQIHFRLPDVSRSYWRPAVNIAGITLGLSAISALATRYGGKDMTMFFEDFALCLARTMSLQGTLLSSNIIRTHTLVQIHACMYTGIHTRTCMLHFFYALGISTRKPWTFFCIQSLRTYFVLYLYISFAAAFKAYSVKDKPGEARLTMDEVCWGHFYAHFEGFNYVLICIIISHISLSESL